MRSPTRPSHGGWPARCSPRRRQRSTATISSASTSSPLRALLDANVVLDVLQRREPWFEDAAGVMAAAEAGRCKGLIAAHTVTTLFCLMAKHTSRDAARVHVVELLRFLEVACVDQAVLAQALALPYADLEDGVQMAAAEHAGAQYLVTRDRALYAAGPLPVLTPGEMLALLGDG